VSGRRRVVADERGRSEHVQHSVIEKTTDNNEKEKRSNAHVRVHAHRALTAMKRVTCMHHVALIQIHVGGREESSER